jgi:RNA binding exosome subunit
MFISAHFRVHCHATEDCEKVKRALASVAGISPEKFKRSLAKGYHGNEIIVFELILRKGKDLKAFEKRITVIGILESAASDLEERLDDDCFFHMRFDKQAAYAGELALAQGEDTVSTRCKIMAHPAKKYIAMAEVEKGLEKIRGSRSKPEN